MGCLLKQGGGLYARLRVGAVLLAAGTGSRMGSVAKSLQATAKQANAGVWPSGRHGLQLEPVGRWFQIQNGAAFHDVHTHGNCSWSGVYYVQIDPLAERQREPQWGALNGATRFYSPMFPL